MNITVTGAGICPESICTILKDLENQYGLKVQDVTMHVHFADENGMAVEPIDGVEFIAVTNKKKANQDK